MSEIEEFDEQMQDLLSGIRRVIQKEIPNLRGHERLEKCSYLKNRLVRAKQVHRSLVVELRDLPEDIAPEWDVKIKKYDNEIGQLTQDVNWAETSAKGDAPNQPPKKTVDEMNAKELTQQAMQVQQQTLESTARTKQIVEQTIEIGTAVNTELTKQGEQIRNIADGVEQVESNLKRADKQLRVFLRRIASDKIFLLFMFLLTIGIVIAIILNILKRQGVI